MMSAPKIEAGLVSRLERLSGEDPECCVPDYLDLSREVTRDPRFATALGRARALADESRMTTVALLRRRGELCACEIQAALGVTHATVSHHMAILEDSGFVSADRRGKWIYYRLKPRAQVEVP
ncbi:MAG: metalloregulator ArsR/SmtB family transcription factor [Thermoplasmata archaeon]|jgi:ArsR family transcriptional regulator|nr:metalloregulator ArsR/SmtB family transcription factor [Thermoplasmata archaeon]